MHEFFGELALITDHPRAADVRAGADGPLECLVLGRGCFQLLMYNGQCGHLLRHALDIQDMSDSDSDVCENTDDSSSDDGMDEAAHEAMHAHADKQALHVFLRTVPILAPLSTSELDKLAHAVKELTFQDGQHIVTEGPSNPFSPNRPLRHNFMLHHVYRDLAT